MRRSFNFIFAGECAGVLPALVDSVVSDSAARFRGAAVELALVSPVFKLSVSGLAALETVARFAGGRSELLAAFTLTDAAPPAINSNSAHRLFGISEFFSILWILLIVDLVEVTCLFSAFGEIRVIQQEPHTIDQDICLR